MSTTEIRGCEDALRLLARHLDKDLDPATRAQMERHLEICRGCYTRAQFERRLKESLAGLRREAVSPELAHRVRSLIRTFDPA